jgi:hypothetical protein
MWRDSWSRAPTVTGSSPRSRPFSSRAARTSSPPTSTRPTRSRNKHGRGAARKGGAHVLAADRVHEAAALVGAFLDDSALQRCHPVGVGESATERATRGSRRMSFAFHVQSEVQTRKRSSSSPTRRPGCQANHPRARGRGARSWAHPGAPARRPGSGSQGSFTAPYRYR